MFNRKLKCQLILWMLSIALFSGLKTGWAETVLKTQEAEISLISAVTATGELTQLPLGLKVQLKEGWKIYWRSPGDAGLPPELRFSPDYDVREQKLDMDFPVPSRFSLFGLDTYGYSDEVIFPVYLRGHRAGQPLDLQAEINALVCAELCIPISGTLELTLPSGKLQASPDSQDIARFASLVPTKATGRDIELRKLSWDRAGPNLILEMAETSPPILDIFIETTVRGLSFSAPQAVTAQRYLITLSGPSDSTELLNQPVRLTIKADSQFADIAALVEPANARAQPSVITSSLLIILVIAFGGGLILNIMPCVLPVLSLKLASLISMSGASLAQVRMRLLAGAAGILTSFALLGLMLVSLKLVGGRLGWGIQFQNLWFLGAMIVLMGLFTLSLLDILRLPVPAFAARRMGNGLAADFFSGFMATILATPCSAPLVGTAVSFALSASPPILFLVMLVMGTGLAAPWLCLALFPRLLEYLPSPGPWLRWVKPVLASGLVATIIWLGWLFAGTTGLRSENMLNAEQELWQVWSPERLDKVLASGQPVFVDITADWCITCKVNKALVLNDQQVLDAFGSQNVLLLQADWTLPDPQIADYLAGFSRFGIPFNILYDPRKKEEILFDELLSSEKILSALDRLKK